MSRKILLADYPHPDGFARRKALEDMGFEVGYFNLVESHIWPGSGAVKKRAKSLFSVCRPLKKMAGFFNASKLNKDFIAAARAFRPDFILVIKGDSLTTETLMKVKKTSSAPLLNWYADSVLTPGKKELISSRAGLFDFCFLVDEIDVLPTETRRSLLSRNKNIFTLPFAANTDFFKPVPMDDADRKRFYAPLSFVGTVNPVRRKILESLADCGLNIWGPETSEWGKWLLTGSPLKKSYRGGCAFGADAAKIYSCSDIVLDIHFLFSAAASPIPNVTARVYEVPACGGFVLTNYSPQLSRLFKIGEEIICYSDAGELRRLIEFYLANPVGRRGVADRGRARVLKEHTYRRRLENMLALVEKNG